MEEHVERVAKRVTLVSMAGGFYGWSYAILKGTKVVVPTLSVAITWGMVGTICFGCERVSAMAVQHLPVSPFSQSVTSHALGGMSGGTILALLVGRKIVPSVIVFTPMMIAASFIDREYQKMRQKRLEELLKEEQDRLMIGYWSGRW